MKYIFLSLFLSSCLSVSYTVDNDDLYFRGHITDTISRRQSRIITNNYYYERPSRYWYPYGGFYNFPYGTFTPNTIIIVPKSETPSYNYGKRPSRDGSNHNSISPRRGRN